MAEEKDTQKAVEKYLDKNPPSVEVVLFNTIINFDFNTRLRPKNPEAVKWLEKQGLKGNFQPDPTSPGQFAKMKASAATGTKWPEENQTGIDVEVQVSGVGFTRMPLSLFAGF